MHVSIVPRACISLTPWPRGCPGSLALVVVFEPPWPPYFSTMGCILGKRAPRVSAGGDLILYTAELRALFPSWASTSTLDYVTAL